MATTTIDNLVIRGSDLVKYDGINVIFGQSDVDYGINSGVPCLIGSVVRYAFDTYPITLSMKVDGNAIDLTDWTVRLDYEELQLDGITLKPVRVNGYIIRPTHGDVKFYPRIDNSNDLTDPLNPVPYKAFTLPGRHKFSVIRTKKFFERAQNGQYVFIDGQYVIYDPNNPEHQHLYRYELFIEEMTHITGIIEILDRVSV
jgi:hypothetical protein